MAIGPADLATCAALAAVASALPLLINLRDGFPHADEGYLWYGTLRTLAGEVPVRDFRAYEPGRYRWCAAFLRRRRGGIVALRVAVAAFFGAGLGCGLVALRVGGLGWPAVACAAVLVSAWAYPGFKLFEPALLLIATLGGTELLNAPTLFTAATAGVIAGLSSIIGVNYCLYNGVALLGLTLLETTRASSLATDTGLAAFAGGVVVGLVPLGLVIGRIRGFGPRLVQRRIVAVLSRGSTNLPLPVPWPWRPYAPSGGAAGPGGQFALGTLFLLVPAAAAAAVVWSTLAPWPDVVAHSSLVAAAFVTAGAIHHAFSRADLVHLAQCMPAAILGAVSLGTTASGLAAVTLPLGAITVASVVAVHPRMQRRRHPESFTLGRVRGAPMWMHVDDQQVVTVIADVLAERSPDASQPVVAIPTLASLLPIVDRRSGVYDTFCVYPASTDDQLAMLGSLTDRSIRVAIVYDGGLDGRADLRFSATHPLVWAELKRSFGRLERARLPTDYHVFVRDPAPG